MSPHRWAIVLAGGEGTRLSPLIRLWRGSHIPKQYCAFSGRRSMLEHTLGRARLAASPERIITVINSGHRRYLPPEVWEGCGKLIEQPANRDTGPGILLPVAHALQADPEAVVVLFPSDHFIEPPHRFIEHVNEAASFVERQPDKIVLLAAEPDSPEREYGWIELGQPLRARSGERACRVARFVEKPPADEAAALLARGGLWNTMVIAAKARTIWELGREHLPRMMHGFETLRATLGRPREELAMQLLYCDISSANFSRDILERAPERILAVPMRGVRWSDWGRPSRIVETLGREGRAPAFPAALLAQLA